MSQCLAYIRVSTARQGERGVSLDEQREAIKRYAQRNNLDVLQWFEEVATLPLEDGGQERGHAEDFCGFGQANHIVNDRLGIVTAQAGELKWLMIDKDHHAVVRREQSAKSDFGVFSILGSCAFHNLTIIFQE